MRSPFTRAAVATLGAAALALPFLGGVALASPGPAAAGPAVVPGSAPAWARSAHPVGAPALSQRISFQVALQLRDAAGAAQLAQAVSTPSSSQYGKYLTPAQFNARFAPTAAQTAKIESYLKSQHITITGAARGNRWVTASATVGQIQQAFRTRIKLYSHQGHKVRAASGDLSVPRSLKPLIAGFAGISQVIARPTLAHPVTSKPGGRQWNTRTAPDAGRDSTPPPAAQCSVYWNEFQQTAPLAYGRTSFPTPNCGYSPRQLRTAYGVQALNSAGLTGRGVTVAIVDAYDSPTILADANAYSVLQNEPQFGPGQFTDNSVDPGTFNDQGECDGEAGWNEEQTLDVEAVHGVAPGASVEYYGAQNCADGIDTALNQVVQDDTAQIVSNSYGDEGEGGLGNEVAIEHSIFLQGAAEGIGFYFSTGDDGDNTPIGDPIEEADYPATDTLVTAVGGTSLGINSNNSYKFETSWGNDIDPVNFTPTPAVYSLPLPGEFGGGGGGGASRLFAQPAYQRGTVPKALSEMHGGTPMRVVPDVADVGDPETGYLICIDAASTGGTCQGDSLVQIGGTSLACPVFAAIQSVASQGRRFPIGFANPSLYLLPRTAFHDVQSANAPNHPLAMMTDSGHTLITMDHDTSLTDTPGFDDTTGLGTPNGVIYVGAEHVLGGGGTH
jgi:subtilase family serine protease